MFIPFTGKWLCFHTAESNGYIASSSTCSQVIQLNFSWNYSSQIQIYNMKRGEHFVTKKNYNQMFIPFIFASLLKAFQADVQCFSPPKGSVNCD